MKIVHFSTTDYGGAYRAADRISQCISRAGIDSDLVVRTKTDPNSNCIEYFNNPAARFISKTKNAGNLMLSKGALVTDLFGTDISSSSHVREADIVFLHWVNSFVSYSVVDKLTSLGKKIIWVMHDMWPFTDGYHYTCNRPEIISGWEHILSDMNIRLKKQAFSRKNIQFVAVSDWIRKCALESPILNNENIVTIGNPLDIEIFRPLEPLNDTCHTGNRKIILFGADKSTGNKTKGFNYVIDVLKKLDGNKFRAVCFGNAPDNTRLLLPNIDIKYTGSINDDNKLIELYNLADVMITPSIQEAFGYTCCEALACGTPVVAFDIGGFKDQITHKNNGYLAKPYDPDDLKTGIEHCVENAAEMSANARKAVVANNSYSVITKKYLELIS